MMYRTFCVSILLQTGSFFSWYQFVRFPTIKNGDCISSAAVIFVSVSVVVFVEQQKQHCRGYQLFNFCGFIKNRILTNHHRRRQQKHGCSKKMKTKMKNRGKRNWMNLSTRQRILPIDKFYYQNYYHQMMKFEILYSMP